MGVVMVMVHMCLYSCEGDNDDILTWPIRYKLKDECHYTRTLSVSLDKTDTNNSRVLSGERGL